MNSVWMIHVAEKIADFTKRNIIVFLCQYGLVNLIIKVGKKCIIINLCSVSMCSLGLLPVFKFSCNHKTIYA